MHLLGLDVGTTGCKAIILHPDGSLKGSAFKSYKILTDATGKAEQDAEEVWEAVLTVIAKAVLQSGAHDDIGALSLSVQGDALIPVDENCMPIHNALLGMDYRSKGEAEECAERFGDYELYERTGMRPHPINFLTKVLFLKNNDKYIYDTASRFVTYADFLLGKLGAGTVIDNTMASRTMAYSRIHRSWDSELLEDLEVPSEKFSKIVPSGTIVGVLDPEVASKTGIRSEVMLATGGHDQTCAALGAGITSSDTGIISTGTAEVFSRIYPEAPINREMFDGFFPCYEYHLDGYYFTFSLNHTGGLLLKWYCDEFCSDYRLYAEQLKENVFSYLDSKCPLGPTDLFFLPHLNGSGTPWCDTGSKGALIGIKLQTDRAAVYKALMESLTYELAVNVELLELNHKAVNEITAVGGGASSDVWMQLKADILGRPIRRIAIKEAGCLGAVMLAGKGVDVFSDYEYASQICVKNAKIFYPSEKYGNIYREKLKVYKELYPALVPFNREL